MQRPQNEIDPASLPKTLSQTRKTLAYGRMATRKRKAPPPSPEATPIDKRSHAARAGRGRPQVLVTLTTEARAALLVLAERSGESRSAVVVRLLLAELTRGK